MVIGIVSAFVLFCIVNFIFIQDIWLFPSVPGAIGSFLIVTFAVLLFYRIMTEARIDKLSTEPIIWFNSAFLFYFTANFFFYTLFNFSVNYSNEFARGTVFVYRIVNVVFYVLLCLSFWKVHPLFPKKL